MNEQKQRVFSRIDQNAAAIVDRSHKLFDIPELGYREFETGRFIRACLDGWGLSYAPASYTGLIVTLGQGAPVVAVVADMDGLPKKAGEGRIHSCGHSLQTSAALALIEALKDEPLSGTVKVIFTPAEEMIDYAYRKGLMDRGLVKYPSGKQDMIAHGVFDDVDCVLSCHASGEPGCRFDLGSTLKGFVILRAVYMGLGAHAGAAPFAGKNALHAALLAQTGVAFLKDRFDPEDGVNVQPVIAEAAGTVNIVPDHAVVETYVRARTEKALFRAADLVENCLKKCGEALGIETEVTRRPGFLPLSQSRKINALVKENMLLLCGEDEIAEGIVSGASGDVGDLGALLPTVQFGFTGVSGRFHGDDFAVTDEGTACLCPPKILAGTVLDLFRRPVSGRAAFAEKKAAYLRTWLGE
ncbi:MAG: amidohydrolase [Clostridia bacterium]|nr:amidohydrolase [Clostridia bacterium]